MNEVVALNVPKRMRLRVADFALLDEAGAFAGYRKTELIDGEVLTMNAQHRPHMYAKGEFAFRLRLALQAIGSSLYVGMEGSVSLSDHDLPEPDIILTSEPIGDGPVPGASVALLVEIADTTVAFDLGRKATIYAAGGVPEFWVVDLPARTIHQHWAPVDGAYLKTCIVPLGETIAAATIPGLSIETGLN
ncbi:Uma2 family endonuclease [Sphingomonas naphthae]|uniref:Uma2 family endonuclease n=1 Tax=Sphingomonas naphthae TaxID=1813468 RepID=A0ABY7TNS5_9SPHN|nr:Uma2 family endonuclease [Sphingomonas naphthae]WCT74869.1 Uma2 family endonuclease [Sphingomonas naphthae]